MKRLILTILICSFTLIALIGINGCEESTPRPFPSPSSEQQAPVSPETPSLTSEPISTPTPSLEPTPSPSTEYENVAAVVAALDKHSMSNGSKPYYELIGAYDGMKYDVEPGGYRLEVYVLSSFRKDG